MSCSWLLLAVICTPTLSPAPQGVRTRAVGASERAVYLDLDRDGDLDVLVDAGRTQELSWRENLGRALGPRRPFPRTVSDGPFLFELDLDGDGDGDVVSSSRQTDELVWFENLGGGVFGTGAVIRSVAGSSGPALPGLAPPLSLHPPRIESTYASREREGKATYLDASGTDVDGAIVLWEWDFESDGVFDHASVIGPGVFRTYPVQGSYQARVRATDNTGLRDLAVVAVVVEAPSRETVTDVEGNVYQTVTLGNQTWMIENLKTTRLNDGTPLIPHQPSEIWNTPEARFQWADTSDLSGSYDIDLPFDFYGAMYNEAALASGQLAPPGWRIPSLADWLELVAFVSSDGFAGVEGEALKTSFGWPQEGGVDAYGFRGLPGGYVSGVGTATGAPVIATWATSDLPTPTTRTVVNLLNGDPLVLFSDNGIQLGAPVRCIKN